MLFADILFDIASIAVNNGADTVEAAGKGANHVCHVVGNGIGNGADTVADAIHNGGQATKKACNNAGLEVYKASREAADNLRKKGVELSSKGSGFAQSSLKLTPKKP